MITQRTTRSAPGGLGTVGSILALAFVLASAPATAQEPGTTPEVTTAVVATGVESREPVGVATSFPASVGRVYFYTVVEGDFQVRTVEHVWVHDGAEVARVPLAARGPSWRTWSSKTIPEDWTGEWEARLVDEDGSVLATAAFQVGG